MMHSKYILQEYLVDLIRMKVSLNKKVFLLSKTNTKEEERIKVNGEFSNFISPSWLDIELEVQVFHFGISLSQDMMRTFGKILITLCGPKHILNRREYSWAKYVCFFLGKFLV